MFIFHLFFLTSAVTFDGLNIRRRIENRMIYSCLGEETTETFKEKKAIWARFLKYELEENPERRNRYIDRKVHVRNMQMFQTNIVER